ncbi:peroxiredoxin-like family protein [Cerasicoccus arenae]|uniref:Peroxiredoxin n=1 Tax=Cerasicoccus arenae TaxID=424488 RepID=A0A8J3GC61_9BACT|nr:peroxiredoxin-like family protein [Cerasicoccus arenae]MBK1858854.1 AhpC/TSA family protein [Cerasicoccus arenae]GHB96064.1 hypothetical protein GCM10007047_09740 [Cerasicoccus arenae]
MVAVESGRELSEAVRAIALLDESGRQIPLGELLGERLTVMVFLRHFGCLACSEHVAAWKPRLAEFDRIGVRVVFIGIGQPNQIGDFIAKTGLTGEPAEVYTEPTLTLHTALGLTNSVLSTIGPTAIFNAVRALSHGNLQTSVQGNVLQQGGLIIVGRNLVVELLHRERTLGDFLAITTVLEKVTAVIDRQDGDPH